MSITSTLISRWIEAAIHIPHDTDYELFDHTPDWRTVVFSDRRMVLECQPVYVQQSAGSAMVTVKLRQRDYDRLLQIIK